jgi:peptidoglycan/xylan/chitin deacetylase (PgdA/CDA1 family)
MTGLFRWIFKEATVFAIRWCGLPWLLRNTIARNRISILAYHDPKPEVLDEHLRYLTSRYAVVTLDAIITATESGDWRSIPSKALVVTLDDGHRGNIDLLEVFRRHGVVPTIFLVTQVMDTSRHYWWTECGDPEPLKLVPNAERLKRLFHENGFLQTREYPSSERQGLNGDEIGFLSSYVDFGSHTQFHPILPMCTLGEARDEILLSKRDVERMTGRKCSHFSYPNGDFSEREIELLRAGGYRSARTIDAGWNKRGGDLFRLKIIGAPDRGSVNHLAASVVTYFVKDHITSQPNSSGALGRETATP